MKYVYRYTQKLAELYYRKCLNVSSKEKLVSFTFDDAPSSAFQNAGNLLNEKDSHATYYVAGCFAQNYNLQTARFQKEDIMKAIDQGHEIACHTFDHTHAYDGKGFNQINEDLQTNLNFLRNQFGIDKTQNFSYPFGEQTLALRKAVSKNYQSARSINSGINQGKFDRFNLKSIQLYENSKSIDEINELIEYFNQTGGWLIFYTHDVEENYSQYGCSENYFKYVLDKCLERKFKIMSIQESLEYIESNKLNSGK